MERKSQGTEVSETQWPAQSCSFTQPLPLRAGGSVGSSTQPWALKPAGTLWDVFQPPKVSLQCCTGCLSPGRQDWLWVQPVCF